MRPLAYYARVSDNETVSFIFRRTDKYNIKSFNMYDVDIYINARENVSYDREAVTERKHLVRLHIGHFTRYRPGLSVKTVKQMAYDMLRFIEAYLERPMEFERSDELEQKCSQIWKRIWTMLMLEK